MQVVSELPKELPPHRPPPLTKPLPSKVVATWPRGTFVENLLARAADGEIVVTIHSGNRLERMRPDGTGRRTLAELPGPPTSLVESADGADLYVFGSEPGKSPGHLWRVSYPGGRVTPVATVKDALFLNGSAPFLPGTALAVDSIRGIIHRFDLATGAASVWYRHELLGKATPIPLMPGVNGVAVFGRHVYVTNTERALVLRVRFGANGQPSGEVETLADGLRADDLAFDTAGNAYLATHVENSLLRLAPGAKAATALAGPEQGMPGATAVRFGRSAATAGRLYVTTTGGIIAPYRGELQEAKLVEIDAGAARGAPLAFLDPGRARPAG